MIKKNRFPLIFSSPDDSLNSNQPWNPVSVLPEKVTNDLIKHEDYMPACMNTLGSG